MEEEIRRCIKCNQPIPLSEFRFHKNCKNPSKKCLHCERKENAQRNKAYRDRNKQQINARLAARRASIREAEC